MSSSDEKTYSFQGRPGRPSCFLHEHLEGAEPLAIDWKTREPTLVGFQAMDRLQLWIVFQGAKAAEDRKRGPRCELVAEYEATWCSETRSWVGWRLLREDAALAWTPVPRSQTPPPAVVTTFPAQRQPRRKQSP